ncbi:MAG: phytoene/squalene synthase family protein [Bacteroidia bacterium]
MKVLYDNVSKQTSKNITLAYSTSFSMGIKLLAKKFQNPIYGIYGFVRLADEIVDTFHDYNKQVLLADFKNDTYKAINQKISLNPVLNHFQEVVHQYNIENELIDTFLRSMEMDLELTGCDNNKYEEYILGSAEVVGLMCLRVFTEGDNQLYIKLKPYAMKLGSAFQKINFLRDYQADVKNLGRTYFPELQNKTFTEQVKKQIEADILKDFNKGYEGIKMLPKNARFGVYLAYVYYSRLLQKIVNTPASVIESKRIRIPNNQKYALFFGSYVRHSLNLL